MPAVPAAFPSRPSAAVFPNLAFKSLTSDALAFWSNAAFTLPAVTSLLASASAFTSLAKLGVTLTVPSVPVVIEIASALVLVMEFTSLLDAIVTAFPSAVRVIFLPATSFTLCNSFSNLALSFTSVTDAGTLVVGTTSVVVDPSTTDKVLTVAFLNAFNCFTFTASVSLVPLATLSIRRVIVLPLPMDRTPCSLLFTVSFVKYPVVSAASADTVVEPSPRATEFFTSALAFAPITIAPSALALAPFPILIEFLELALTFSPIAIAAYPVVTASLPMATPLSPVMDLLKRPIAIELCIVASARVPIAMLSAPVALT